jgi:hypothetical protein
MAASSLSCPLIAKEIMTGQAVDFIATDLLKVTDARITEAASPVNLALPQQEGERLLAFAAKVVCRLLAGSHEIGHRLTSRVRRPDSCQCAGPSRASVTASRRFVLMRSPDRFCIKAGATTTQSWPRAR